MDIEAIDEIYSDEQVQNYILSTMGWKKLKKYYKYTAHAVFGVYTFYKLTYICLVKEVAKVGTFIDEPVYETK
jgi:hypothetical protein